MYSKTVLVGRIGKEPRISATKTGTKVASFSVATSDKYKNAKGELVEDTEWHSVVAWGAQAEFVERYLSRGRLVLVDGKNQTRKFEHEGVAKYTTEVKAFRVSALDSAPKTDDERVDEQRADEIPGPGFLADDDELGF